MTPICCRPNCSLWPAASARASRSRFMTTTPPPLIACPALPGCWRRAGGAQHALAQPLCLLGRQQPGRMEEEQLAEHSLPEHRMTRAWPPGIGAAGSRCRVCSSTLLHGFLLLYSPFSKEEPCTAGCRMKQSAPPAVPRGLAALVILGILVAVLLQSVPLVAAFPACAQTKRHCEGQRLPGASLHVVHCPPTELTIKSIIYQGYGLSSVNQGSGPAAREARKSNEREAARQSSACCSVAGAAWRRGAEHARERGRIYSHARTGSWRRRSRCPPGHARPGTPRASPGAAPAPRPPHCAGCAARPPCNEITCTFQLLECAYGRIRAQTALALRTHAGPAAAPCKSRLGQKPASTACMHDSRFCRQAAHAAAQAWAPRCQSRIVML